MTQTKTCWTCGAEKSFSDFYKLKGADDGHRPDCKACMAEADRLWRKTHRGNANTYQAKRRSLKIKALCTCCQTTERKQLIAKLYERARSLGMHVDHVRPLAKGGTHCWLNLQLLGPVENMRKGAKWKEAA